MIALQRWEEKRWIDIKNWFLNESCESTFNPCWMFSLYVSLYVFMLNIT